MRASMRMPMRAVEKRRDEVDDEARAGEADDREDVRPQRLRCGDDRVVDRPLHEQRDRDRDQRVDEREREPERAQTPLAAPERGAAGGRSAAGRDPVGLRDSRSGHDERPARTAGLFRFDDSSAALAVESLVARARTDERREPFAEARRRQRRLERLPDVGDLAAAERPFAVAQLVPLRVETLAEQRELALAPFEPRLQSAQLVLRRSARTARRRRRLRPPALARLDLARAPLRARCRVAASSFSVRRASSSRSSSRSRSAAAS